MKFFNNTGGSGTFTESSIAQEKITLRTLNILSGINEEIRNIKALSKFCVVDNFDLRSWSA
jgi:hypothetical protein